jgi:GT2 family glycosyltransferase
VSEAVTAVVVHWRDVDATVRCVQSLAGEPVRIVVVDNGGVAPVRERLREVAPAARCIATAENLGYAGGANVGLVAALDEGAQVVLVLNDDVEVRPGATAAACAALRQDDRIAVVGARVLLRDDPRRLWLAWGELTFRHDLVALVGAGEPDGPRFGAARDVPWVAGCAMWMRAAALRALGLLAEEYFAYLEEVEWCVRARRAGWRVRYVPEVVVTHGGRGTSSDRRAIRVRKYFTARNMIWLARRHGTLAQRAKLATFLAGALPLQLLWQWPRGRADEVLLKLRGVRDALTGRRPPFEELGLK